MPTTRTLRRFAALSMCALAASSAHAQRAALVSDADASISCNLASVAGTTIRYARVQSLTANGLLNKTPQISLPATPNAGQSGSFVVTGSIHALFDAGVTPGAYVSASNPLFELTCTMAGREVTI